MASPQKISDQNLIKDENVNNDSVSENEQNTNSLFDITTPHESNAYPEERESKQSASEEKKTNKKVNAKKETDNFDPKDAVRKDQPIKRKKKTAAMGGQSKEVVSMPWETSSTLKDQPIEREKTTVAMGDQSKEAVSMPTETSSTLKDQPIEREKTTVAMGDQSKEAVSMPWETSSTLKDQPIEREKTTVAMGDQSKEAVSMPWETSSTLKDQPIEREKTTVAMGDQSKEAVSMPWETSSTLKDQPIEREKTTVAMGDQSKEAVSMSSKTSYTPKDPGYKKSIDSREKKGIDKDKQNMEGSGKVSDVMPNPTGIKDTMNDTDTREEYKEKGINVGTVEYKIYTTDSPDGNQSEVAKAIKKDIRNPNQIYPKKYSNKENVSNSRIFISLAVLTVMFSVGIYQTIKQNKIPEEKDNLTIYFEEIEKLKPIYAEQTEDFWNIIRSFPYFLLTVEDPESPAILLTVTPAGSLDPALKLSKQIAQIFNNIFGSHPKHLGLVDGDALSAEIPDDQKMMIDEQIRNMVDNHGQRAVIVTNLEKIDPKAIMIFHAYCDNTEAVYKNIAIILLLELPPNVQAKNSGDIHTHLSEIWNLLGRGRTRALFTRMANNIAILKAN